MTETYPDFIRFWDAIGLRQGYCKITNIHDGLFYFELASDKREYILPKSSVLIIIKNAKRRNGDNER